MYVEAKNVEKYFGDYHALDDVSFSIEKGELIALLGPSGSGKTTILRIIAGLDSCDSGDILIDGKVVNNVSPSERGIGFVFQNYALFRYMTVYENIAFGLDVQGASKAEIDERVHELVGLIGLEGMEDRYPNQLSGGQRQRVAFARALAPRPQVLLLDEPFAAIDAKVRHELRQWLREMITQLGITSIFVTHDQEEALEVSDRIIVMSNGKIEQVGAPSEIYETPETAFVAHFAGNSPVVENYDIFNGFEKTDPDSTAEVRAEYVEAFRADNPQFAQFVDVAQECTVENVLFRGFFYDVVLNVGGTHIHTRRNLNRRPIEVGTKLLVYVDRLHIMYGDNQVEVRKNPLLTGKEIIGE